MKKIGGLLYKYLSSNTGGKFILNLTFKSRFRNAAHYWETRYQNNGTSGPGSYGDHAAYKAGIINKFILDNNIATVIEFGCGDSNQLKEFQFPNYTGLDVSITAIEKCIHVFKSDPTKSFFVYDSRGFSDKGNIFKADLSLSLDVIYHLLEDDIFESYMRHLFSSSKRFVIIYAWDVEAPRKLHLRYRKFTNWVRKNLDEWDLVQTIENKTSNPVCDFYIYQKQRLTSN